MFFTYMYIHVDVYIHRHLLLCFVIVWRLFMLSICF